MLRYGLQALFRSKTACQNTLPLSHLLWFLFIIQQDGFNDDLTGLLVLFVELLDHFAECFRAVNETIIQSFTLVSSTSTGVTYAVSWRTERWRRAGSHFKVKVDF